MTEPDGRRMRGHLPGSKGIRTFIFIDMLLFGAVFLTFSSERHRLPGIFAASQLHLDGWFGFANTIILLTSSRVMVGAVEAGRTGQWRRSGNLLTTVFLCGAAFCALKILEYGSKFENGITPLTNSFYSLYFFMTGLHLLHLVGAMIFIAILGLRSRRAPPRGHWVVQIENVGLFWHFIDIAWLFIFPMLYLTELR